MLQGKWTKIEVKTPLLSRSSHKVSVITNDSGKSSVYVFGGEHVARNAIDNKLLRLDLDDPTAWTVVDAKGTPPVERFAQGQVVINGDIYIFGGRQGVAMEEKALDDMHVYSVKANEWKQVEYKSGAPPSQRSFHGCCSVGAVIYVFGGCDNLHGRCNDLFAFDTGTRVWKQMPTSEAIKGRGGATLRATPDGKHVCVISGFSGEENNDVHMFELATEKWTQVENKDFRPRSVCTSATLALPGVAGGAIVLFGGEVDISQNGHEGAGEFEGDVMAFSGTTGKLLPLTMAAGPSPAVRGWASGAPLGNSSLILVGGLTGSDANPVRLDDVYRLDLTTVAEEKKA